jgi:hypothetical protein
LGAPDNEFFVLSVDGEAGGIISPILESCQSFENDGNSAACTYITNNATHTSILSRVRRHRWRNIASGQVVIEGEFESAEGAGTRRNSKFVALLFRLCTTPLEITF